MGRNVGGEGEKEVWHGGLETYFRLQWGSAQAVRL